jgi:hypothetical protein
MAQPPVSGSRPIGDAVTVTVSSSALALTLPAGVEPSEAHVEVENAGIRYRTSGSAPTADDGMLAPAGSTLLLHGAATIRAFRMIRSTSSDAVTQQNFFGP